MFPSRVLVGFFKSSLNVDCKQHVTGVCVTLYSVSQKNPPYGFLKFFPKRLGIFNQYLHTYCTILSTLDYKFLFKYLQL